MWHQGLRGALLEHRAIEGGDELKITHEDIAKDAGTAREVVHKNPEAVSVGRTRKADKREDYHY